MNDYTLSDKIKEIKNELNMRQKVYPRLVESGKMSLRESERKTDIMQSILKDYEQAIQGEFGDLPLFK